MKEIFSIIMANYNNGMFIKKAINSVLAQTYHNWELIIVDDDSTDDSVNKIQRYLNDKRIKLICHNKNLGYAASTITGIRNAGGEILGILDPDDKLAKQAIKTTLKIHYECPDCSIVFTNYYICDEHLNIITEGDWSGDFNEEAIYLKNQKVMHFRTFKMSSYKKTIGLDKTQLKAVDRDLIYKLEETGKVKYIDEPLYYYRKNQNGISQGKNSEIASFYDLKAIINAYQRRFGTNTPNLTKAELQERLIRTIFHCFKFGHYRWTCFFAAALFRKNVFGPSTTFCVVFKLINIRRRKKYYENSN